MNLAPGCHKSAVRVDENGADFAAALRDSVPNATRTVRPARAFQICEI